MPLDWERIIGLKGNYPTTLPAPNERWPGSPLTPPGAAPAPAGPPTAGGFGAPMAPGPESRDTHRGMRRRLVERGRRRECPCGWRGASCWRFDDE